MYNGTTIEGPKSRGTWTADSPLAGVLARARNSISPSQRYQYIYCQVASLLAGACSCVPGGALGGNIYGTDWLAHHWYLGTELGMEGDICVSPWCF